MSRFQKKHIMITRPADDALELADAIAGMGYLPVIEPMLEIVPLDFTLPDHYDALVFTSANAVRIAAGRIEARDMPVYCVGGRTASAAKGRGFTHVESADGGVEALNAMLAEKDLAGQALLHLSGEDIAAPVEVEGVTIINRSVYKAQQAERFSAESYDLLMRHEFAAIMLFSARTAEAFSVLIRKYGCQEAVKETKTLCLADSVVKSVEYLPWLEVKVAQRPDRTAMLDLLDKTEDK